MHNSEEGRAEALLADLKTVIDLLDCHVDSALVISAICNVDVLAAVAQAMSLRHPFDDPRLLCQWNHCKPEAKDMTIGNSLRSMQPRARLKDEERGQR